MVIQDLEIKIPMKEGESLAEISNSSIRDKLKFEKIKQKATLDLSHLGWIKEVKQRERGKNRHKIK